MRGWATIITILLVACLVAVGVLFSNLYNKINYTQSQITALISGDPATPLSVAEHSPTPTLSIGDLINTLQPEIVRIDASGSGFESSGSGIIIRKSGMIITNNHVIDGTDAINVTLSSDKQYAASVTSVDTKVDLAIIQLKNSPDNLPVAKIGSKSDIFVGETVIAVGFPLGPRLPGPASFTRGIISALRTVNGRPFIQSDAEINPGNSGGALVNNKAEVIGITSASVLPSDVDAEGLALAIPVDVIQTFIDKSVK